MSFIGFVLATLVAAWVVVATGPYDEEERSQSCRLLVKEVNKPETTLAMIIIYFRLNWLEDLIVVRERGVKEDEFRYGSKGT